MNKLTFIILTIISIVFIGCTTNSTSANEEINSSGSIVAQYHINSYHEVNNYNLNDSTLIYNLFDFNRITIEHILDDIDTNNLKLINFQSYNSNTDINIYSDNTISYGNDDFSSHINNIDNFSLDSHVENGHIIDSFNIWTKLNETQILQYYGKLEVNYKYTFIIYIFNVSKI